MQTLYSTLTSPNLTKIWRGHVLSFVDSKWNDPLYSIDLLLPRVLSPVPNQRRAAMASPEDRHTQLFRDLMYSSALAAQLIGGMSDTLLTCFASGP